MPICRRTRRPSSGGRAARGGRTGGLPHRDGLRARRQRRPRPAVARIFAAKGRPADHPLIVHVADVAAAPRLCRRACRGRAALMAAFWPGPLTLSCRGARACRGRAAGRPRRPALPVAPRGAGAVARVRRNWAARRRRAQRQPFRPRQPHHRGPRARRFGAALLVLDGGACEVGIESTIVDCSRGSRAAAPGRLTRASSPVLGAPIRNRDTEAPRASGTLASHYAPAAPVRPARCRSAAGRPEVRFKARRARPAPWSGYIPDSCPRSGPAGSHRVMPADAAAAAHELFAVLREFDAAGVSAIWVEQPPPGPEWDGVRIASPAQRPPDVAADLVRTATRGHTRTRPPRRPARPPLSEY